ncbi:MAG: hypothetical protein HPM95_04890 [Alphaproteobacteria bacterium]|nr:hypothetical protein [Alphaproteobacteria bacterium]
MIGEITGAAPACASGEMLSIGGLGLGERLAEEIRALDVFGLAGLADLPPAFVLHRSGKATKRPSAGGVRRAHRREACLCRL